MTTVDQSTLAANKKNRHRKNIYIVLGPVAAVIVYLLLGTSSLSHEGKSVAAIATLMGVWWVSEALPLGVASLVPIIGFPLLGALPESDASMAYANPSVFLFLGGFLLALGVQTSGLDERIAITTISLIGSSPARVVAGFMLASGFVSMFVSNGATTMMMLPIALAVISLVREQLHKDGPKFAVGLLIGVAYAATIGGLASLVGAPVNLIAANYIQDNTGISVTFLDWLKFGLPFAVVLMIVAWWLITQVLWKVRFQDQEAVNRLLQEHRQKLGPLRQEEKWCMVAFAIASLGWIVLPLVWEDAPLSDSTVAVIVGVSMFIMPASDGTRLLNWQKTRDLPWDVLLLFGAGFSLSAAVSGTDLNDWIGNAFSGLGGLPMLLILAIIVIALTFLTEFTSSTAVAATFIPIIGSIATGLGFEIAPLVVAAGYACLLAFALPVGTPPNAVIFASGEVKVKDLMKSGLPMNLVGIAVLMILSVTLIPMVM
ncbi:MAG TPA: SLC13 family permease [Candidatus Corynebacterium avicola]|uniref:Sodium-dependent dicarboxylate transporter SdcS n=1 Tax=Candidatus Corynebacterium avicola TaxID=2838527 RepID=A0A9D1UMC3_9CORY|nr:SLC13 family permease [Candidatus Corynebacterium avicola]